MRRRGASSSLGRSWTRRSFGWLAGGRPCPGEHVRRLRRRGPCAHAAARKGWPVFTGAATALLLRGAAARRDAGRDLAWPGSGFSLAPRPRERGGWQNRRGNIGRCLRQATLGRREFFARPQLNPTELRVACRRATMSRRAYAAAAAARPLCRRRSSQRLACFHRRDYGAAAAWSGGTTLAGTWLGRGAASAWRRSLGSAAVGKTVAATSGAAFGRRHLGGVSSLLGRNWTRRSFGWLAGGQPCPGELMRRLRRRGPYADAAARKGWLVFTGAATALLLRGAVARRDAGRGLAWPAALLSRRATSTSPARHSCPRRSSHWWRELFARLRAGPDSASGGLPAAPLSWRASSTAPARHPCPRRSSDRPACLHRRGFDVSCCSKAAAT